MVGQVFSDGQEQGQEVVSGLEEQVFVPGVVGLECWEVVLGEVEGGGAAFDACDPLFEVGKVGLVVEGDGLCEEQELCAGFQEAFSQDAVFKSAEWDGVVESASLFKEVPWDEVGTTYALFGDK